MAYIQLILALVGLFREALRQLNAHDKCNLKIAGSIKKYTIEAKKARENGNTKVIEDMFSRVLRGDSDEV